MNITGHSLREHIRLLKPLFVLIAAAWLVRFLLHEYHAPSWLINAASITVVSAACVLVATVMIHLRRFGSYVNVVLATFLLVAWTQLLVVVAIGFAVLSGRENIYSIPEYSFPGPDPYHLKHILGHLTFGVGGGVLIGSAMGCLLLLVLRLLVPKAKEQ